MQISIHIDHNAPLPTDALEAIFELQSRAADLYSKEVLGGSTGVINGHSVTVEVFAINTRAWRGQETKTMFKANGKRISYSKLCKLLEI